MKWDDEYYPDDETIKKQEYQEFELSDVQEKNLKEIEDELKNKKITILNKKDMLEYLQTLYTDVLRIKKEEYPYEGDSNFNINRALEKIKNLIQEVEKVN